MNTDRNSIVVANWKMNLTISEAIRLATEVKNTISGKRDVDVVLAPPFTSLHSVSIALDTSNIFIAAQNMHYEDSGAFTGEISPLMLTGIGCKFVILGHSERRTYFSETNSNVNKKLLKAIENSLIPIVCIGETLDEREKNKTFQVLETQVRECIVNIEKPDTEEVIIAYEPIWAIGTGKAASASDAENVHQFVRNLLGEILGKTVANKTRIIYGGSVKPQNCREFVDQKNIDGFLVGGASLDASSFAKIVQQYA